jgi:hypothetical protein
VAAAQAKGSTTLPPMPESVRQARAPETRNLAAHVQHTVSTRIMIQRTTPESSRKTRIATVSRLKMLQLGAWVVCAYLHISISHTPTVTSQRVCLRRYARTPAWCGRRPWQ